MKIITLNKLLTFLVVIFFFGFLVAANILYDYYIGIGNGYRFVENKSEKSYIAKGEDVVIPGSIINLKKSSGYVFGIRLPSNSYSCDEGQAIKLYIKNEKNYFILNIKNGSSNYFTSKFNFEDKLKDLQLEYPDERYSLFDTFWANYSNFYGDIDLSSCVIVKLNS